MGAFETPDIELHLAIGGYVVVHWFVDGDGDLCNQVYVRTTLELAIALIADLAKRSETVDEARKEAESSLGRGKK